jgi:DNA-binding response OmpR family regulator
MESKKILIIDDDPDIRRTLQVILESNGYHVITSADPDLGMEMLKDQRPDLLILDVMMTTWQDGFVMSREIRNDSELKNTPILMLTAIDGITGFDFKDCAGDSTWVPVDTFLNKPVESQTLLEEVDKLLSRNTS